MMTLKFIFIVAVFSATQEPLTKVFQIGKNFEIETVKIPSGYFLNDNDQEVLINGNFWMAKYEITQEQWNKLMGEELLTESSKQYPKTNISWYEVNCFLEKLNSKQDTILVRLPTEAEWEYVARIGDNTEIDISELAWTYENSNGYVQPVGTKKKNELGLYDMYGNVWEWVSDWHNVDYYGTADTLLRNPLGPLDGLEKVRRGGSVKYNRSVAKSKYRYQNPPDRANNNIGFRVIIEYRD